MDNVAISNWCIPIILVLIPIFVVGLYFLRKSRYFIRYYGVGTMIVLYLLCAFRIFVPIEFPFYTIHLRDEIFFTKIYKIMVNRSDLTAWLPIPFVYILLIVWGLGAAVYLTVYFIKYIKSVKVFSQPLFDTPESMLELLDEVKEDCKLRCKVNLIISSVASSPATFGIFKKYIVLPAEDYAKDELRYIFLHECTHIKNRDVVIKLLTEFFVAIFWWNPFAYLLKKDLFHVLEVKCDQKVLEGKTKEEKLYYCDVLLVHLGKALNPNSAKSSALMTVEFAHKEDDKRTKQRINYIIEEKASKKKSILVNTVVFICAATLIFSSYFIQWRPYFGPSPDYDEQGNTLSNKDNAYVLHKKDGTYEFFFAGHCLPVPEEEIRLGYYDEYPIIEEE